MGTKFILLIRVIRARVITGFICFMFMECVCLHEDIIVILSPVSGSLGWVVRVIRVICGFYFIWGFRLIRAFCGYNFRERFEMVV
jgi:hypothetical protein